MNRLLRLLFVILVAYPVVLAWLGVSVVNRKRLPHKGPAIIIANHNSHLDLLTLLTLFPLSMVHNVQPAAAADYFLKNRFLAWFATRVVGIIPVIRGGNAQQNDPLAGCAQALQQGKILILFPEGTRGEPERLSEFKSGLWFLCQKFPDVPVMPVFMHGLGRAMGKGQWIPVPFFIDVHVDEPVYCRSDKTAFISDIQQRFESLQNSALGREQ
ncbi:lysophospholipid acyltransferase family protein [Pragia fontium]|uniref:1-acyl-sn-glycerol-3-phosphate acyltransferase n=1 Tax=Pragia fontium TaxID=82985 RepID=A0ABQ5LET3_9GAMM|nr:lysophospholipid acyltransferase family protein [Pragia fontium]AKJ41851.1 acyltransferase [Pragia fontium]GKX62128.1 1-acyl-sn-glycerol-3-phosphate acyltransferase [Pragia fontium]SUB82073.1 2-acyl-glycerophospho-ethanolamine acyltransferase [Pragia fontium]VEJ54701.1 2-acyl-glycerophospho-ethanolamine acyltransferase [Pragia fontium]